MPQTAQNNKTLNRSLIYLSFVLTIILCVIGSMLIMSNQDNSSTANQPIVASAADLVSTGQVAGVSDTAVLADTTTQALTTIPVTTQITQTLSYTNNTINGKVPSECLKAGSTCSVQASNVGKCANGVCGAIQLTFTVTPDASGHWSYDTSGLAPGTYQATIKDQNGNILEVSNFTITSSGTTLPKTGVVDDAIYTSLVGIVLIVIGSFFYTKFKRNTKLK